MSLQHIKLKPVFYLKSKNSYFTKICKLQQKWQQNSSPITCEQNMIGEMEKEKRTRASKGCCNIVAFLSQALTEILHLKNTWLQFLYILKWNNVLFEQLHRLEPSMWQYLFQAPQNCSSPAM